MGPHGILERDVILRDGTTLRLRPPTGGDAAAVLAFFEHLSPESVYRRFHGVPRITPRLIAPFLDPDWHETGALIGTLAGGAGEGEGAGGAEGRIVALASYVRLRAAASAEAAFAVANELQGRGVGTRLLEQLAEQDRGERLAGLVVQLAGETAPLQLLGLDDPAQRVAGDTGGEVDRDRRAVGEGLREPQVVTVEARIGSELVVLQQHAELPLPHDEGNPETGAAAEASDGFAIDLGVARHVVDERAAAPFEHAPGLGVLVRELQSAQLVGPVAVGCLHPQVTLADDQRHSHDPGAGQVAQAPHHDPQQRIEVELAGQLRAELVERFELAQPAGLLLVEAGVLDGEPPPGRPAAV